MRVQNRFVCALCNKVKFTHMTQAEWGREFIQSDLEVIAVIENKITSFHPCEFGAIGVFRYEGSKII
jgi:hypothetical protein